MIDDDDFDFGEGDDDYEIVFLAPTPAPLDLDAKILITVGEPDTEDRLMFAVYAAILFFAVLAFGCYARANPESISSFTTNFPFVNSGGPEGSWMAVSTSMEEDEDGTCRRVALDKPGCSDDIESGSGGGGCRSGGGGGGVDKGEPISEHERARAMSVRYRELRANGMGASEAMAKADLETPRRRYKSSMSSGSQAGASGGGSEGDLKKPKLPPSPSSSSSSSSFPPPNPPLRQQSSSSFVVGAAPRCDAETMAKLVGEEAKLSTYRSMRKEGHEEKQVRRTCYTTVVVVLHYCFWAPFYTAVTQLLLLNSRRLTRSAEAQFVRGHSNFPSSAFILLSSCSAVRFTFLGYFCWLVVCLWPGAFLGRPSPRSKRGRVSLDRGKISFF
jgi:hypothetical protein